MVFIIDPDGDLDHYIWEIFEISEKQALFVGKKTVKNETIKFELRLIFNL